MFQREMVVRWLEEAYGMESVAIDLLGKQLPDFAAHDKPDTILLDCLSRDNTHTTMLQECITRLGGELSSLRNGGLPVFLSTLRGSLSRRRHVLVQDLLLDIAMQHFKIATYATIVSGAEQIGERECVRICQTILQEERGMAGQLAALHMTAISEALES